MAHTTVDRPNPEASSWSAALRTPLVLGLGALLVVQLLFAAVTSGSRGLTPAATDTPLAQFDAGQIDSIEIATPDDEQPLVLNQSDGGWVIPALDDFPADATRIDQLLQTLADLHRPLPIATSEPARKRFKVADDAFEQRITLRDGADEVATLLLGDSPGFRRRYLRPADDEGIYDVRFEVFNLSDQPDDWIAHDQLRLDRERIQRLAADDWVVTKEGDHWTLEGGPAQDGRELDQAKVDELLTTLANLGYRAVLGPEAPADFDPEAPMLALEIGLGGDTRQDYLIAARSGDEAEGGRDYVLKVENNPHYFVLSDFDLGPLVGLDASGLVKSTEAEDGTPNPAASGGPMADSAENRDQQPVVDSKPDAEASAP